MNTVHRCWPLWFALHACTSSGVDAGDTSDAGPSADTAESGDTADTANAGDTAETGSEPAPGELDDTFGTAGVVLDNASGDDDRGRAITVQPDGKILVAGKSGDDFLLLRFNVDGSLDTDFSGDGRLHSDFNESYDEGKSIVVQDDGKIVLAGITTVDGNGRFSIARYQADGELDTDFGTEGRSTANFGAGNDEGKTVVILADGSLVMGGQVENETHDFALVRFTPDGAVDESFGKDGWATLDLGGVDNEGNSLRVQADGKLVLTGYSGAGTDADFAVVRFNEDGSPDRDFGSEGVVTTPIGSGSDIAFASALQSDGQIVAAGIHHDGTQYMFAAVRYSAAGVPDASFGDSGIVRLALGENDECTSVVIQSDGGIMLGGATTRDGNTDFALVRYDGLGLVDATFGTDGVAITPIGSRSDGIYAMALQADGRLVVAGDSQNDTDYDVAVARYHTGVE